MRFAAGAFLLVVAVAGARRLAALFPRDRSVRAMLHQIETAAR